MKERTLAYSGGSAVRCWPLLLPRMKAYDYILAKQSQWALNHGVKLVGSKGRRGRPAYTNSLEDNLFEPLLPEVRVSFEQGDGSEIMGSSDSPAKMQAVHSSSALGVNIFHYWQRIGQVPEIAAACGFCKKGNHISKRIVFEDKYPIDARQFRVSPNIDVVIHNAETAKIKRFAVECKFSEAYTTRGHSGIKERYIELDHLWGDIPRLYDLAKSICPEDERFIHLHAAQLIKHILGLKGKFGKDTFRLLYLWYDVLGEEGHRHRKETDEFSEVTKADGVRFHTMSYQELIVRMSREYRSGHEEYIKSL